MRTSGRLGPRQCRQVRRAVLAAEAASGLQFCVYVGEVDEADPRSAAVAMLVRAGLEHEPAVLVVVAPTPRRIELVTSPAARARLDDATCALVVEEMRARFGRADLADGIVAGLARLSAAARPGPASTADLPDLVNDTPEA